MLTKWLEQNGYAIYILKTYSIVFQSLKIRFISLEMIFEIFNTAINLLKSF